VSLNLATSTSSARLRETSNPAVASDRATRFRIKDLELQLRQLRTASICALNQLLDLKDLNTGVHSTRLAEWSVRVAEHLGVPPQHLNDIEAAAILHDIGKIGVPESILNKPAKLTPEERKIIEKHSEYGWAILRGIPGFQQTSLLVLHHHERIDGNGYPSGLKGEETPLGSRIVCIVDSFDAMISDRVYRKGLPVEEAFRRLRADSGTQFDAEIVELFTRFAMDDLSEVSQIAEPLPAK